MKFVKKEKDEIVSVLERKRTRGDGIDFAAVQEIRHRLIKEKGYVLVDSIENEGASEQ